MKTTVTDGQLGQLAAKQHELFRRFREGYYASPNEVFDALQLIIEGKEKEVVPPTRKAKAKPSLLTLASDKIELPALMNTFDPRAFKTRDGLWVSDDFARLVLANAEPVLTLGAGTATSFNLKKDAYDSDIKAALPKNHEWNVSELCARIAQMIERQPNGKEGDLLANGYWNLFYVPGFVVYVYWHAGHRRWYVDAWELDDSDWRAGGRVFVSN